MQGCCQWRRCLEEELSTTVASADGCSDFFLWAPASDSEPSLPGSRPELPSISRSLASHLLFLEFSTTKCDVTLPQLPLKGRCVARSPAPNTWCHKSNSAGQSVGAVVFWLPIKLHSLFFRTATGGTASNCFFPPFFFYFGRKPSCLFIIGCHC